MSQTDLIIHALTKRGEREVTSGSASRFRKFTRQYYGDRDAQGQLRPVKPEHAGGYWFVGRHGALRVGRTSSGSVRAKQSVKDLLVKEGG